MKRKESGGKDGQLAIRNCAVSERYDRNRLLKDEGGEER